MVEIWLSYGSHYLLTLLEDLLALLRSTVDLNMTAISLATVSARISKVIWSAAFAYCYFLISSYYFF